MSTTATRAARMGAVITGVFLLFQSAAEAQDAGPPPSDVVPPPSATPPSATPPSATPPAATAPGATTPNGTTPAVTPSGPPVPGGAQLGATAPGINDAAADQAAPGVEEPAAPAKGGKKKKKGKNQDDAEGPLETEEAAAATNGRAIPGDPFGEERGGAELGVISLRAMIQSRYTATFAAASTNVRPDYVVRENYLAQQGDGWGLNRFFLRIAGDPTELVGLKAILDFAELAAGDAEGTVKQAYAVIKAVPKHVKFVTGLFKLPFSTIELDPIARYEFAHTGPTDDLIKDLGYAGRDYGAEFIIAPFANTDWLHATVGAFRGHTHDEHDFLFGTVGARLESEPMKGLRLGADMVDQLKDATYQRPFDTKKKDVLPNPPDPFYPTQKDWGSGRAWSADVSFERYHLAIRAEAMIGDRVDIDETYGARTFASAWGLIAYRFRTGPVHLMPGLRAEWLDGDREHKIGARRVLSAAMNVILSKNARIMFDVTRSDVEKNSPILDQPKPLQVPPFFDLSYTRLVGQLQIEM